MPITDLATNPFWLLFYSTGQLAGVIAIALVVVFLRALWVKRKVTLLSVSYLGAAGVMGLATYELSAFRMRSPLGPIPGVAVLLLILLVVLGGRLVHESVNQQLIGLMVTFFMVLVTAAMLAELLPVGMGSVALANLLLWLALLLGLATLLVHFRQRQSRDSQIAPRSGSHRRDTSGSRIVDQSA
ncbi:MAG: hypothetical protein WD467_03560 [Candidatus Saccharimonadales bacterium]